MTAERVAAADGVQRRSAGRASTARPHLALFPRRQQNKCALKTSAVPSWIYVGMRPPPFSGARFPPGTPTAAFPGLTTPKCIFHYLTQYDNSIIILSPRVWTCQTRRNPNTLPTQLGLRRMRVPSSQGTLIRM